MSESVPGEGSGDAFPPYRHRCPVAQGLMWACAIEKADPGGDSSTRLAAIGIALEIDILVFQGAPQAFDEDG